MHAHLSTTPIPVICGPTAAGKSALALQLAQRAPITLISADSRQIYRHFDIGTATPTAEEMRQVPHELVNVAQPDDRWSAWRWAEEAREAILRAIAAGRQPVIVGGTGFYVRALTQPIATLPPLDDARRAALAEWLDSQSAALLQRWCERLDPERALFGPVQWKRAIEVALLSGAPLSQWHRQEAAAPPLSARYLVVDPGPSLAERIESRIATMLNGGWVEEVEQLMQSVPEQATAWNAAGYGNVRAFVRGTLSRAEMEYRVLVHTRQYAKRQRTWYRHQLETAAVTTVSPADPISSRVLLNWWATFQPHES